MSSEIKKMLFCSLQNWPSMELVSLSYFFIAFSSSGLEHGLTRPAFYQKLVGTRILSTVCRATLALCRRCNFCGQRPPALTNSEPQHLRHLFKFLQMSVGQINPKGTIFNELFCRLLPKKLSKNASAASKQDPVFKNRQKMSEMEKKKKKGEKMMPKVFFLISLAQNFWVLYQMQI